MNLAIVKNGCIKADALEDSVSEEMKKLGIDRCRCLDEADYLLYITCSGVGETIQRCITDLDVLYRYSHTQKFKIIVVGCLLVKHPELFKRYENISNIKLINNPNWTIPVINYVADMNKRNTSQMLLKNRVIKTSLNMSCIQFVLENGCTNKCSFCKTNYNDSKVESLNYELSLAYLKKLVEQGTRSITLDGENTTLYGLDLYGRKRLHEFIHELSLTPVEIIRIHELVAGDMYPELINEIISNPKVKSVSMQLETASDRLLKLMKRNYTLEQYDFYVRKIIEAGKYVDTILMSGFPTETYEDMETTIQYLNDRRILTDGVCQYVDFKYIPSSKLEQFSKREKQKHTIYIRNAFRKINQEIYKENLSKQNRLLLHCEIKGYHAFESDIPGIVTISKSSKHPELKLGQVLDTTPKQLVKKSSFNGDSVYKL